MDIKDLTGQCGAVVTPGFGITIYAVCPCDIETYPAFKTTTAVGDSITLDGDIVLKTGKKFATITAISETVGLNENSVGVVGSKAIQNDFNFKALKTKASDDWVETHLNGCFLFVIKNKEGQMRVVGSPDVPATLDTAVGVNGLALSDEKNWALKIMDNTGHVAPYYEGEIDLVGA